MEQLAYSKGQIFWGTILGGPITAVYFLKKNFDLMGNREMSDKTLRLGAVMVGLLFLIVPFLPDAIPSVVYGLAYAFAAQQLYETHQISLKDNPKYSNWNVAAYGLGALALTLGILIPIIMLYQQLGLVAVE